MLVLDIPPEHTNFTSVGFRDTGCIYRMPKSPEEKLAMPLIIQMWVFFFFHKNAEHLGICAHTGDWRNLTLFIRWFGMRKTQPRWEGFCMYVMVCQVR